MSGGALCPHGSRSSGVPMRAYHEPERPSTPHSRAARKAPYSFATAASDRSEQPMREALRMRGSGSVLPVADLQANACSDVYQLIVLSPTPLTPPPSLRRRAPRRALSRMQRGEPSCAIVAAGRAARAKRGFMNPPRHAQRPFQCGAVSLGYQENRLCLTSCWRTAQDGRRVSVRGASPR